jgi:hypothetical protein
MRTYFEFNQVPLECQRLKAVSLWWKNRHQPEKRFLSKDLESQNHQLGP